MIARLHDALSVVIKVVNHIKSNSLQDRLFREFYKQNGEEFEWLVLHTEVSIPFEVNVAEIELSLQEPLIELQSDEITRAKSKDEKYNIRKTTDVATKYPLLWDKAQFYVIAFPTSYLVEAGFSRVSQMLSKARNRLDIVKRGDLRLSLTSIEPNIKKLVEKHQPHGSH
ncbi:hypothetical protein QYM36_007736 [Artemia franciscana]|uniref:SCAN domain-containing protein 3 n=1 Tax=Artemia franciscana TaxID=6661 RepID=A0AA88INE6_ARTSF|nr:hypothetical protein QYM36_007736 [Artemia franciscana]